MKRFAHLFVLVLVVLATLVGCSKSQERRAELEQMLTEYNQLIDETASIAERLTGGDLGAMQAMAEQMEKATAWTTKWEDAMTRLGPELNDSDKEFLETEFKKSLERFTGMVPQP